MYDPKCGKKRSTNMPFKLKGIIKSNGFDKSGKMVLDIGKKNLRRIMESHFNFIIKVQVIREKSSTMVKKNRILRSAVNDKVLKYLHVIAQNKQMK